MNDIRQKLSILSGVNIEIGQPISHRIDAMLSGTRANIAIKVFGTDLNRLYSLGSEIKKAIADVKGIADLNVEQQVERPQLTISPRRQLLARMGITLPEFSQYVRAALAGEVVSQINEGGKTFDLTVKVSDNDRQSIERVKGLLISTAGGQHVPLEEVADIRSTSGPNTINRENARRRIVVSANVAGRDMSSVVADIRQRIDTKVKLPQDYHVEYGGQFEKRSLCLAHAAFPFRSERCGHPSAAVLPVPFLAPVRCRVTQSAPGSDRRHTVAACDGQRHKYSGHHRLYIALRHSHARRHAPRRPL